MKTGTAPRRYGLAASNIGWAAEDDERVLPLMRALGYTGLELAPTRVFPQRPYDDPAAAARYADALRQEYGFCIPSLQSIWYGQTGSIFVPAEAEPLATYTGKAFAFAAACGCKSLVFGCPRNRNVPEGHTPAEAEPFFARLAADAARQGVVLALEANPPIYHTNYLNTTAEAFALVKRLALPGLAVNLDLGTILHNGERVEDFAEDLPLVSHLHISEPGLVPIVPRPEHLRLARMLREGGYAGFVSVEMGRTDPEMLRRSLDYVAEVFA